MQTIAGVIFMEKEHPDAAHELRDPKIPPVRGSLNAAGRPQPGANTPRD